MSDKVKHPALRYAGGKWRLAQWIISQFPPHVTYVEPFGGGANVLLQKTPSPVEVYNDLDSDLVNFWDVLRTQSDALVQQIEFTPYSEEVWKRAFEPTENKLERALRFYIRSWQSFGMRADDNHVWRRERNLKRGTKILDVWCRTKHLWNVAERLKKVQLYNRSYNEVISFNDSPQTLFYIDPPYVMSARSDQREVYKHEMGDDAHIKLAEILNKVQGMVVLSGYASDLYEKMFSHWRRLQKSTTTNGNNQSTEYLWLSPKVTIEKLPLFAFKEAG